MSLNNVKNYFKKYNIDNCIIELTTSSATVKEAAVSLNTTESQIAKTLSFLVADKPILIVTAGDTKIDNSKFKSIFHEKAHMIPSNLVNDYIGHEIGGVCPFATKEDVTTYLDESLKRFPYVYPACGSSNSAIKLSIQELEKYTNYKEWIDVCKYQGE